jgi:hypothetical protein
MECAYLTVAVAGDMKVHVWNVDRGTRVVCTPPSHTAADAVGCLEVCTQQQLMFTADNAGCVQTWDIAAFVEHAQDPKPSHFTIAHAFRCHASAVTSLQYISSRMLLVTGSADFTVAAWSISGAPAGVFGLTDMWQKNMIAERDFVVDFERNTAGDRGRSSNSESHARVDAFLTQLQDENEGGRRCLRVALIEHQVLCSECLAHQMKKRTFRWGLIYSTRCARPRPSSF